MSRPSLKDPLERSTAGQKVMITGAARGLGLRIARMLAPTHRLVLSSRLDEIAFSNKMQEDGIAYEGYHQLDFACDPSAFLSSIRDISDISILVHNASPYIEKKFFETENQEIIQFGNFATNSVLLIRNLRFKAGGKIVFVGSSSADPEFTAYAGGAIYGVYKSTMQSLALSLMKEFSTPIPVVINPGLISEAEEHSNDAVASRIVEDAVRLAVETDEIDNKIVPIYPTGEVRI